MNRLFLSFVAVLALVSLSVATPALAGVGYGGSYLAGYPANAYPNGYYYPNSYPGAYPNNYGISGYPGYPTAPRCQSQATAKCISNVAYWYNSCGALESIRQNCNLTRQICSNGQCVTPVRPAPAPKSTPKKSAPTPASQPQPGALAAILFLRNQAQGQTWAKGVPASPNDIIDFWVAIKNTSAAPESDVTLAANLANVTFSGNLTVNGQTTAGNIMTGIDLGSLVPGQTDLVTFSAAAPQQMDQPVAVSVNARAGETSDVDSASVLPVSSASASSAAGAATVSSSSGSWWDSPFFQFIRQWYLLIIIVVILLILFVIIFRRLASEK